MSTDAPTLPNYKYIRDLGHGGFADVYLYQQDFPRREVAVKVLKSSARTEAEQRKFRDEANRTAMLSHPGIVTIYEVGVTADDRPYLTMRYYPSDHLGRLAKRDPLSVPNALRIGVKVASAVDAAHRAGVLHRDIKPANILLDGMEPALTDFGIAGAREGDELAESEGVSIPFAAPEVLAGESAGDERSDVYSLAATVYATLAGRSPYGLGVSGDTDRAMVQRILGGSLPPVGREDVPRSLEQALAVGMARDPGARYASAVEFGRALQRVETELGLPQTPLPVAEALSAPSPGSVDDRADDDGTKFKAPQRVDPDGTKFKAPQRVDPDGPSVISAVPAPTGAPATPPPAAADTSLPVPEAPAADHTIPAERVRQADDSPPVAEEQASSSRAGLYGAVAAGVVLLVIVAAVVLGSGGGDESASSTTAVDSTAFEVPTLVGPPVDVAVSVADDGTATVTWSAPDSEDGDTYRVTVVDGAGAGQSATVAETSLDLPAPLEEGTEVCVEVRTVRGGSLSDASRAACGAR